MSVLREEVETVKSMIIEITPVVDDVESQLEIAIKSIEDTVLITKDNATLSISELRGDLTQKVSSVFSTITAQVHVLFAKQKQAELAQLQTVVTAQLEAIGRIIAEDKATGVKGFLGKMKTCINGMRHTDLPYRLDEKIQFPACNKSSRFLHTIV
ncbi:hypothetical protein BOVATA_046810 [Babesia ovata]|nr:uncharacterized protein BOVATA_046810 [Babesia ovata]GBE63188.1 hypothetical protein BOVATA_046810 [Babesia ovata]